MHIGGYATSLLKRMIIPSDGSTGDFIILDESSFTSLTIAETKSVLGVTNLEDKYVKCLWFEVINSGTSGTLTPPTSTTILLDQWSAGVDAVASTLSSGVPTLTAPETSGGVDITATLDVSGNWTLSGTPAAYPVAIIYCYKVKLKDFDDTKVLGGIEVVIEGEGGGEDAVTSVNGMTGDVVITIPVTSVNSQTGDVVLTFPVTSVNSMTGDVSLTIPQAGTDYLTPETLALTYEPILPITPESPETKFLNGNRVWSEITIGSGGYAANVYPISATSTVYAEYKRASYTNDATETVETITCTTVEEVVGESFLYESPLGITNVDAGTWNFSLYCKISTKAGAAQIKFEIFVRESGGTETILFSKYSADLSNTAYQVIKADYTGPIYPVNATDRMGLRLYFKSSAAAPVTLSYVYGGVNTSYINTPLNLRHTQLRGLNDDTNYQHITSTQVGNIHAPGSDNQDLSGLMEKSQNLNDISDKTTARSNLGVSTLAEIKDDTDIAAAISNAHVPGSDNQDLSGLMVKANNLSDLVNVETSRQNLGVEIGVDVLAYSDDIAFKSTIFPGIAGRDNGQRLSYGNNGSYPCLKSTHSACFDLGTKFDFSCIWEGSYDSWSSTTTMYFFFKHDGTHGVKFGVYSDNKLFVTINADTYYSTEAISFGAYEVHSIAFACKRVTSGSNGIIDFYIDGIKLGESVIITTPATLTTTSDIFVSSDDTRRYSGSTSQFIFFNRYLIGEEIWATFLNGASNWDTYGSCESIYTSDFSADTSSLSGTRVTISGNNDGIYGVDDCLKGYASSDNGTHFISKSGLLIQNKWFKITLDYYIPSTNTNVNGIRVGNTGDDWTTQDAWTTDSKIFYYTNPSFVLWFLKGTAINFAGAGSSSDDIVFLKNITIEEVGSLVCYDSNGIQPGGSQWLDTSTNKRHLMQPDGTTGGFLQKFKKNFEIRWTCIWNGTHEAQYIGGQNRAILPVGCYITSIIGTVSGATINDIIIGDGSDTDHWVAITSGLAAGVVNFTIANPTSDGTNYKLVVDPDANFTGSISWVICGFILE